MRIISGKYKGKKIFLPKDKFTRPLRDLVKESIFNILKHSSVMIFEIDKSILKITFGNFSISLRKMSACIEGRLKSTATHSLLIQMLILLNVGSFSYDLMTTMKK